MTLAAASMTSPRRTRYRAPDRQQSPLLRQRTGKVRLMSLTATLPWRNDPTHGFQFPDGLERLPHMPSGWLSSLPWPSGCLMRCWHPLQRFRKANRLRLSRRILHMHQCPEMHQQHAQPIGHDTRKKSNQTSKRSIPGMLRTRPSHQRFARIKARSTRTAPKTTSGSLPATSTSGSGPSCQMTMYHLQWLCYPTCCQRLPCKRVRSRRLKSTKTFGTLYTSIGCKFLATPTTSSLPVVWI